MFKRTGLAALMLLAFASTARVASAESPRTSVVKANCGLQLIVDVATAICGGGNATVSNISDGPDGCSFDVTCW